MQYLAACGAESPEPKAQLPHMRLEKASMEPARFGCGGGRVSWCQSLERTRGAKRQTVRPVGSPVTYRWRTGLESVLDVGITRRDELLRELDDIAAREKVP